MGAPLYFIEGVDVAGAEALDAAQLRYALDPGCPCRAASNGPGGAAGVVCSPFAELLGYFPDAQEWHEIGERGGRKVWFGWRTESPIGPADLLRRGAIRGVEVTLFDDRQWIIPQAMRLQNGGMVPTSPATARRTANGWTRGDVKTAYRQLDWIGRKFWDGWFAGKDSENPTIENCLNWAAQIIAINYRVSEHEVGVLGLLDFDNETALTILKAVIDYQSVLEFQQKKTD